MPSMTDTDKLIERLRWWAKDSRDGKLGALPHYPSSPHRHQP
jgi:hypothetical protein